MRMTAKKRRNEILAAITRNGNIKVNSLAHELNVSMETIRNDIRRLEKEGVLKKIHGGAILASEDTLRHINKRITENIDAKNALAAKAIEFIPDRATVYVDSGSTTVCVARQLSVRSGLTVVTNSLLVANSLSESRNEVMLLGGLWHGDKMGTSGIWATNALRSIFLDAAILDCSGIKGFEGPVVNDFSDAELKRVIIQRAKYKVVLADSRKLLCSGRVCYCQWREVDAFVTNADADREAVRKLEQAVNLVLA